MSKIRPNLIGNRYCRFGFEDSDLETEDLKKEKFPWNTTLKFYVVGMVAGYRFSPDLKTSREHFVCLISTHQWNVYAFILGVSQNSVFGSITKELSWANCGVLRGTSLEAGCKEAYASHHVKLLFQTKQHCYEQTE